MPERPRDPITLGSTKARVARRISQTPLVPGCNEAPYEDKSGFKRDVPTGTESDRKWAGKQ